MNYKWVFEAIERMDISKQDENTENVKKTDAA